MLGNRAFGENPTAVSNKPPHLRCTFHCPYRGIVAVVSIGDAAYYYFKFVRGKRKANEVLDFFDEDEDEQEDED